MMKYTYNIETVNTIEVVEATNCRVQDGCLVFLDRDIMVKAFAPNQWTSVWRI